MATQPTPQVSVQPATPMSSVPKAVTDKRMTIPAQPHPGAAPATVATETSGPPAAPAAPTAPAAPANDQPSATPAGVEGSLDPAIAALLDELGPDDAPAQPVAQPAPAQPVAQPAVTQESQLPAPNPALSFDAMFAAAPEAPPQAGDNAELVALRDQVASMQTMLESRQAPAAPATQPSYEISDDERERYGDSIKLIERIASAHATSILTKVDSRLSAIEDQFTSSIEQVQTGVTDMRASSYSQQLELQVPDLNQLTNHGAFQGYTHQTIPFSGGITVGQRLRQAHQNGELSTVVALMKEFRDSLAGVTNDRAVPAIENMAQPATTAAPVPAAPAQQVQRQPRPWSVRTNAARELRAGRLTQEKFDRIDRVYREADAQGLVDYQS